MKRIVDHLTDSFRLATDARRGQARRIGVELKFPVVDSLGAPVPAETIRRLWAFLAGRGWEPWIDGLTQTQVGARLKGERNHTVASSETGYCKVEFSLAHVETLHQLNEEVTRLRDLLAAFTESEKAFFLCHGIHPVAEPGAELLVKKERTAFWERLFESHQVIPRNKGDDIHLFALNASNQVHVDVTETEAIRAVNVLNGFAAAQIALTAHSSIWRGSVDPQYRCVSEMFWDWWRPARGRAGVPHRPFRDLRDYAESIAEMSPVYVKRDGNPLAVTEYETFYDYFASEPQAFATRPEGGRVAIVPRPEDIQQHLTFQWFDARLSRYQTVENRLNDQQPPQELLCVAALSLGLVAAAEEAWEELSRYPWEELRLLRTTACRSAEESVERAGRLEGLCKTMLLLAEMGLLKRALGEETYLRPLNERLIDRRCPADDADVSFRHQGMGGLVERLHL